MTFEPVAPARPGAFVRDIEWSPIVIGALAASALSFILVSFAAALGLGVASTAPTWRDASTALWILSGVYLILQAIVSFGVGGYIAGRLRPATSGMSADQMESIDGIHGLAVWALAVVIGALLAGLVGSAAISRTTSSQPAATTSAAEPMLSYELDRLYRAPRRNPNLDLTPERAEAGRILLTASGHSGISTDDRAYLIQQVSANTGLSAADSERRVDTAIANARSAIGHSRHSTVILAFSIATALLLGAVAAWAAACAGGQHRDGAPYPDWVTRSDAFGRRKVVFRKP